MPDSIDPNRSIVSLKLEAPPTRRRRHPKRLPSSSDPEASARTTTRARANELLALISRRKQSISEDFYDIGLALAELSTTPMLAALGHKTFRELLARIDVSASLATRLMGIVRELPRKLAVTLGQEKSIALVQLAAATADRDTAASLATAKLHVPGVSEPVDLSKQTGRAVRRLVAVIRRQSSPIGSAIAKADRVARSIEEGLLAAGLPTARARTVKHRRKGAQETIDLELRLPIDALAAAAHVLAGVAARP